MQQAKKPPIPDLKLKLAMLFVVLRFSKLLSLLQTITDLQQELVTFQHLLLHRWQPCVPRPIDRDCSRITTITTRNGVIFNEAWNEEL